MGYWMIKTVKSGKVIERTLFYAGERKPRSPKAAASSAARKEKNLIASVRSLARGINCNFGPEDYLITLDYAVEPTSAEAAEAECALFWRRLARAVGGKLRGYRVTADKDAEDGQPVRLHHHLVVGGEGLRLIDGRLICADGRDIEAVWGLGGAGAKHLHARDDYTGLAAYLVRQAAGGKGKQKWHSSRGLKKPVVESLKIVDRPRPLRAPGGADVHEVGAYDEGSGSHYIRYVRRPKDKVGGHKDRGEEKTNARLET